MTNIPICFDCQHFNDDGSWTCKAFPEGIPDVILSGKNDHEEPLEGQNNDLVFTDK